MSDSEEALALMRQLVKDQSAERENHEAKMKKILSDHSEEMKDMSQYVKFLSFQLDQTKKEHAAFARKVDRFLMLNEGEEKESLRRELRAYIHENLCQSLDSLDQAVPAGELKWTEKVKEHWDRHKYVYIGNGIVLLLVGAATAGIGACCFAGFIAIEVAIGTGVSTAFAISTAAAATKVTYDKWLAAKEAQYRRLLEEPDEMGDKDKSV